MTAPPPPRSVRIPAREKTIAELLSQHSELIECLFLVMNGVPFDVAFSLDDETRLSWVVIVGQLKGLRYNWDRGSWDAPS